MTSKFNAVEVTNGCPACRDDVHTQKAILVYKRVYLCEMDRTVWDAADAADRAKEERRATQRTFAEVAQ